MSLFRRDRDAWIRFAVAAVSVLNNLPYDGLTPYFLCSFSKIFSNYGIPIELYNIAKPCGRFSTSEWHFRIIGDDK
jgi:hypothetical protein